MDYYLVPGANWSLLKKGEVVYVLGQAQETGWYRCMALRQAQIKLDHSIFSTVNQQGEANQLGYGDHRKTRSLDGSYKVLVEQL